MFGDLFCDGVLWARGRGAWLGGREFLRTDVLDFVLRALPKVPVEGAGVEKVGSMGHGAFHLLVGTWRSGQAVGVGWSYTDVSPDRIRRMRGGVGQRLRLWPLGVARPDRCRGGRCAVRPQ